MTDVQALVYDLAIFLHDLQHKSKRIAMCASDLNMAESIVALLQEKGVVLEDDRST